MTISDQTLSELMHVTSAEMKASLDALFHKYGTAKVLYGMALVNTGKFMGMARAQGLSEPLLRMLDGQFEIMLQEWMAAAQFDQEEMFRLAAGLREQIGIIETDLNEKVAANDAITKTTKET